MYKSLPKIKTFALILTVVFAASAQFSVPLNARKAAIAEAPLSDISDLYRYPAIITGYTDHLQATWNGGIFATKGVNEMLSIGLLANQGLMAPQFAEDAADRLNAHVGAGPGRPGFNTSYNIPHLLLGFDLGAFALGLDVFFEYAGYSGETTTAAGVTSEYRASVIHPGVKLGVKLDLGEIGILGKFGMGFPSINGEVPAPGTRLSTASALYMEVGGEARVPLDGFDLIPGAEYTRATHRFQNGNVQDPESECNSRLDVFVGAEFNFVETAAAAVEYRFRRDATTTEQPDASGTPSSMDGSHFHIFRAGLENIWEDAWIFDAFFLRAGVGYVVRADVGKTENGSTTTMRYSDAETHVGVTPRFGIGVSRDFFTIDVSLDLGAWDGLVAGPAVAIVTGTIKF